MIVIVEWNNGLSLVTNRSCIEAEMGLEAELAVACRTKCQANMTMQCKQEARHSVTNKLQQAQACMLARAVTAHRLKGQPSAGMGSEMKGEGARGASVYLTGGVYSP